MKATKLVEELHRYRYKSGEGIVSRPAPAVRTWQHVAEIP
jgi:hypothetical protein